MGIKLETTLENLRKLQADKPGPDMHRVGIVTHTQDHFTIIDCETVDQLMSRINACMAKQNRLPVTAANVQLSYDGYGADVQIVALVDIAKTTQELQKEIDAAIERVERQISRRNNKPPVKNQQQQRKALREQALGKLTKQERKALGV